jgi:hypothetical protein
VYVVGSSSFSGDIDDVSVKEIGGWQSSNITFDLDTTNKRTGTYAGKITATSDEGYLYQDITLVDESLITCFFAGKSSTAGHRFKFIVVGNSSAIEYYDSDWQDSITYIVKACTFVLSGDTSIRIKIIVETSGEVVYVDDCIMQPMVEFAPSTESPTEEDSQYGVSRW